MRRNWFDVERKTRVQAVVLDMDGLMIDTESIYKRAWQNAAAEFGYILDDDFYRTLIGQPNPACEAAVLERFGLNFPLAEFRVRWSELWQADVENSGIPTKTGLAELLSFLDEHRLPSAIATSSDREYATFSLRMAGLEGRFSEIVTGDQVVNGKPAPDIYLESARRLGVLPQRCVAVEDSEAGVLAASDAGMITLMVPDLIAPSAKARSAAFSVLASLLEVRDQIASLITT
jgi:beta-phosphoglucomutase-like phosphatase (HAD superfamily)